MDDLNDLDRRLRQWLRTHHGLITRGGAIELGASPAVIRGRLDRGEWEPVFPAVYRDTARAKSAHQTLLAASLAAGRGRGAVASHRSAAWLWDLLDRPPASPELTLHRADQHGRRLTGVRVHQSRDLDPGRCVLRRDIPCTTAFRTLLDLAAVVDGAVLTDAVDRALAARAVTIPGVMKELDRMRAIRRSRLVGGGPAGIRPLLRIMAGRGFVGAPQPSVLESRTLRLFRRYQLPVPAAEVVTGRSGEYRLDLAYPAIRLAIEVDGYAWHSLPEQQQRDHARRNRLHADGWRILVYTWRDVVGHPERVATQVASLHRRLAARLVSTVETPKHEALGSGRSVAGQ